MTGLLGIGIGAPGLGKPLPSPGSAARVHVRIERDFGDGHPPTVQEFTALWDGYTAATALDDRLKRLRDAHADVTRHGTTLTTVSPAEVRGWTETTRLTFEDAT